MTEDEHELSVQLPHRLADEQSRFGNLRPWIVGGGPGVATIDQVARAKHAALLERQTELKKRIHFERVQERWVKMKYRDRKIPAANRPVSPLTPMGMDEVIEGGKIVDQGG